MKGRWAFSTRYPTPLEAGMVISNEPGYYKTGAYGIRIENLVLVTESSVGDGNFLELENPDAGADRPAPRRRDAAAAARARLAQRLSQARLPRDRPRAQGRGEGLAERGDAGDLTGAGNRPSLPLEGGRDRGWGKPHFRCKRRPPPLPLPSRGRGAMEPPALAPAALACAGTYRHSACGASGAMIAVVTFSLSFPRRRESRAASAGGCGSWIPACAGMTMQTKGEARHLGTRR